jgi:peptidoglycan/LPS O-acetylase OafA/YrhL
VYPLACFALARLTAKQLIGAAFLTVVVAISFAATAFCAVSSIDRFGEGYFGPSAGLAHGLQDSFFRWLVYFAPYTRFPEFLLGCLTAALYRANIPSVAERRIGAFLPFLALALVAGADLFMASPSRPFPFLTFLSMNFGFALPIAVLLFGLARYETALGRGLSRRWMVSPGDASYSIYLLHGLILPAAGLATLPTGQFASFTAINLVRLAVTVVVIVGFSMLTYRLVEDPARRFLRRALAIELQQPAVDLRPAIGRDIRTKVS